MQHPKVCIFDIDNTLTVGAKHACRLSAASAPPAWPENSGTTDTVRSAVRACHEAGFKIGIASTESRPEETNAQQLAFLRSLSAPDATRWQAGPLPGCRLSRAVGDLETR